MNKLADEQLEPAKKDAPPMSGEENRELLDRLRGWSVVHEDGIDKLGKVFRFPDYQAALTLTDKIAAIAEQANHHPAILLEWGKVTVTWWTHTIHGLHRNDFIMAARCDRVALLITAP